MKKIIEYNAYNASGLQELVEMVNMGINAGWVPIGGIFISPVTNNYFQSMIRYEQ